jgi:hypothetical protein
MGGGLLYDLTTEGFYGQGVWCRHADGVPERLARCMLMCSCEPSGVILSVLQLEEELADTKATAVRHESSFEASATRVKSLERQLSEARDSLAAGSSA